MAHEHDLEESNQQDILQCVTCNISYCIICGKIIGGQVDSHAHYGKSVKIKTLQTSVNKIDA